MSDHPSELPPELAVYEEGRVDFNYPVGILRVPSSGETVQVIVVGRIQEQFLVTVPQQAWHRTKKHRVLPSLSKPVSADVVAVRSEARQDILEGTGLRVWLGYLGLDQINAIEFDSTVEEQDASVMFQALLDEDSVILPYAQSLVDLAQEHFAFVSASEGLPRVEQPEEGSGSPDLASRVSSLEKSMGEVVQGVQALLAAQQKAAGPSVEAGRRPARCVTINPEVAQIGQSQEFPSLDPGVVQAALRAGVDRRSLEEMQSMMLGSRSKTKKLAEPLQPRKLDAFNCLRTRTTASSKTVKHSSIG